MDFVFYYYEEADNEEIFWIASSRGTEEYALEGMSAAESKKFVRSTTNISGYHIKPVRDSNS